MILWLIKTDKMIRNHSSGIPLHCKLFLLKKSHPTWQHQGVSRSVCNIHGTLDMCLRMNHSHHKKSHLWDSPHNLENNWAVTCNPKEQGTCSWHHGPSQRRDLSCRSGCQLSLSWGIWDPSGSGNLPSASQRYQPSCGVSSSQWGLKPAAKPVIWTGREKGVISSTQSGKRDQETSLS